MFIAMMRFQPPTAPTPLQRWRTFLRRFAPALGDLVKGRGVWNGRDSEAGLAFLDLLKMELGVRAPFCFKKSERPKPKATVAIVKSGKNLYDVTVFGTVLLSDASPCQASFAFVAATNMFLGFRATPRPFQHAEMAHFVNGRVFKAQGKSGGMLMEGKVDAEGSAGAMRDRHDRVWAKIAVAMCDNMREDEA